MTEQAMFVSDLYWQMSKSVRYEFDTKSDFGDRTKSIKEKQ